MPDKTHPPHHYCPRDDDTIYHYTSTEAALAILKGGCIWLSDFEKTNDSSEFIFARDEFMKHLRLVRGNFGLKFVLASAIGSMNHFTKMLIGSFTTERDDLAQWRTYAENGKGCVLGFNAQWIERYCGISMRRVVYETSSLNDFASIGLGILEDEFSANPHNVEEVRQLAMHVAADLFAFKHPSFSSENEIRISRIVLRKTKASEMYHESVGNTIDGSTLDPLPIKSRQSQHGTTVYLELPYSSINETALKSFGIGPIASLDTEKLVKKTLESKNGAIQVWRSTIPMR
jgi:Protein of unknown function (DUF2971)